MTVVAETKPNALIKGIFLILAAVLFFAVADVTGKYLVERHPVVAVAAVRYIVNAVLLLALLWPSHRNSLWKTNRTVLVALRGLILVLATLTMMAAIKVMPIGEAVSILYLYPFLVMLLAAPILGERVLPLMWVGAAISFAGVLLIARPGSGLNTMGVLLMLLNVGLATAFQLMTRALSETDSALAMSFHAAASGSVIFTVLALATVSGFAPGVFDFAMMVLLGVLSTAGHFLFAAAFREAPASTLAPVNYLHLVFAGLLGASVFGHIPDGLSMIGMSAIALAGIFTAVYAAKAKP